MAYDIEELQFPYAPSPDANTVSLFDYTGRGIISHAKTDKDGAGNVFLCVALPNETNPNYTFCNVYRCGPGQPQPGTLIGTMIPTWKIDHVHISVEGTDVVVSANTHEPKEAPRDSKVEEYRVPGVWTPVLTMQPQQAGACVPPDNDPYFLPNNYITRGQAAKMIAVAVDLPIPTDGRQSFQDIPPGSTFYGWIEAMKEKGAVVGTPCVP